MFLNQLFREVHENSYSQNFKFKVQDYSNVYFRIKLQASIGLINKAEFQRRFLLRVNNFAISKLKNENKKSNNSLKYKPNIVVLMMVNTEKL